MGTTKQYIYNTMGRAGHYSQLVVEKISDRQERARLHINLDAMANLETEKYKDISTSKKQSDRNGGNHKKKRS